MTDTSGNTASAIATVTVGDLEAPTVAAGQTFAYPENRAAGEVLGTVGAADNVGVAGFSIVSGDPAGFFAIEASGGIALTPAGAVAAANDFETAPSGFTLGVEAVDGSGNAGSADVGLTVTDLEEPPVISAPASVRTDEDTPVAVPGLAVSDDDSDRVTVTLATDAGARLAPGPAARLTVADGADGTLALGGTLAAVNAALEGLAYAPRPDGEADGRVSMKVKDPDGGRDTAEIRVDVHPVNDAPAPAGDALAVPEDGPAGVVDLLANDADAEGDGLALATVAGEEAAPGTEIALAAGAVLAVGAGGAVEYDPAGAFEGLAAGETAEETIPYAVSDGAATSDAALTVTVEGANDAPAAQSDAASVSARAPGVRVDVLANDTDADGDPLSVASIEEAGLAGSALVLPGTNGGIVYRPDGAFDGLAPGEKATDTLAYSVSDGAGGFDGAEVTITVEGAGAAAAAADDALEAGEDDAPSDVTEALLANDAADVVISSLDAAAALGEVTLEDGRVRYAPGPAFAALGPGETGEDAFGYALESGAAARVTVTVAGANDAPLAAPDALGVAATAGPVDVTAGLLANDADPEGDALEVAAVEGADGAVFLDAGAVTYDPAPLLAGLRPGESAEDAFAYTVSDGALSATATATVTVTRAADRVERLPGSDGPDEFVFEDLEAPRRADGGAGADSATLPGALAGYAVAPIAGGFHFTPAEGEPVELLSVEEIAFAGGGERLLLDRTEETTTLALVYEASFDRKPDFAGLAFWTGVLASGTPLDAVADAFAASEEFRLLEGETDAEAYVRAVYTNATERGGDGPGVAFWTGAIEAGALDRGDLLVAFATSDEVLSLNENATDDGLLLLA